MNSQSIYGEISTLFQSSGFNLIRRIKVDEYDHQAPLNRCTINLFPDSKTIILVGFAGRGFWKILQQFLAENPEFRDSQEDWIDEYTLLKFASAARILNQRKVNHKFVLPFGSEALTLDFMQLGHAGGIGTRSLLGILIHPEYGTWVSLRGAIVTDLEFSDYDTPLPSFNPCTTCPKPCISACPGNTISERGWDWKSCMNFRLSNGTCSTNCTSRRACPYGKEHQYSEEQLAHHHGFVLKSIKKYWKKI